jgi:hypothetical protein
VPNLILQQVSSPYAKSNRAKTLDKPVALKFLKKHLTEDKFNELVQNFPDGKAYFWGVKYERGHQIERMFGALVLFRQSRQVFRIAAVATLLVSDELAEFLWGRDRDGETWGIIYAMKDIRDVKLGADEINEAIGRKHSDNWQGMTALEGEAAKAAIEHIREKLAHA